jgi:hypothetical protein
MAEYWKALVGLSCSQSSEKEDAVDKSFMKICYRFLKILTPKMADGSIFWHVLVHKPLFDELLHRSMKWYKIVAL